MPKVPKDQKLIFDFDSTFIKLETLDIIADIVLDKSKESSIIKDQIKHITNSGMEGKISFKESLTRRLKLLNINRSVINSTIQILKKNISDSFLDNVDFIKANNSNIYILSGGFIEIIFPIVNYFGISQDNIVANRFIFKEDNVIAVDPNTKLLETQGKAKALTEKRLSGNLIMIGDGYTDLEVKLMNPDIKFIAYCENIKREAILNQSDFIVYSLSELIDQTIL